MEPVRTHRSKQVVDAARLHRARHRRERGLTLVEGPQLVGDVLAAGAEMVDLFTLEAPSDPRLADVHEATLVDERALARLAGTKTPRGPVAVVRIPADRVDPGRNLVVAVGVSDPGNVGTMIRTAASFGWGYASLKGSADPWAPKTIRAGAGGQFQTPISRLETLEELAGWTTVATVVRGGMPPEEVTDRPVALLVGEEAHGLPPEVVETAELLLSVPMTGTTESLNAAVAAGIAMYQLTKPAGPEPGRV